MVLPQTSPDYQNLFVCFAQFRVKFLIALFKRQWTVTGKVCTIQ